MSLLSQKKFLAKKANQEFVTLSLQEVDALIQKIRSLDELIAKCMNKLSPADYQEIFGGMFGDCPSDSG